MKTILVILSLVVSSALFASDNQEKQQEAKAAFAKMSDSQALASNFERQIFDINMPGTSTWFNPLYSLCINGNSVQTIKPFKSCVLWSVKGGDDDNWEVKTFKRLMDAEKYGNNPTCASYSTPVILSTPINYKVEACVLWAAKGGDDDNWEVKTFQRKMDAEKYADHAYCVETGIVSKTMPTSYKVDFYRNKVESNRYVGSRIYPMASCDGSTLPPVLAN